ncbi:MAG: hypothetical protein GF317_09610 [Candidatus Lokiarchaeota archaeon]|nr:hypothetical protein [Candidatus Lokiarchaeota archaeon]MBD3199966.1 hypothetical protein [Candidatus Lokiarchaeota archaeon]
MKVFEIGSNVKVIGQTIMSIVDAMGAFKARAYEYLEENGIKDIKDDGWYSAQGFLNVLKKNYERTGDSSLKVIGMKVPEKAVLPPQIDDIVGVLNLLDKTYQMNHQGGNIGNYSFTKTGDRTGTMVCDNPYPCAFDQALIESFMNKFRERGALPSVKHAEGDCRMEGANSCTYNIKW